MLQNMTSSDLKDTPSLRVSCWIEVTIKHGDLILIDHINLRMYGCMTHQVPLLCKLGVNWLGINVPLLPRFHHLLFCPFYLKQTQWYYKYVWVTDKKYKKRSINNSSFCYNITIRILMLTENEVSDLTAAINVCTPLTFILVILHNAVKSTCSCYFVHVHV